MRATRIVSGLILASLLMAAGQGAQAQDAKAGWHIDRLVVVMRHGIRPPTKPEPLPGIPHQPFPAWDVGWGELTHHGERAVALLGAFDRAHYEALLGAGCPAVHAVADTDQRTIRTAQVYVEALLPGCGVNVEHMAPGAHDPRFSPFEGGALLAPAQALAAARSGLPGGSTEALDRQIAPLLTRMDGIIACGAASCALTSLPTKVSAPAGHAKLGGALALGGSLSETLALEYAEGLPMAQVGWGRADRATISQALALHPGEYRVTARPLSIARAGSRTLLSEVFGALGQDGGPAFSLFLGHDTNLALIGGALDLHWQAPQFPQDDPPPGGALIFERWCDGKGHYRLSLRFRAQSLDEMRDLSPMAQSDTMPVRFAPCGQGAGCTLSQLRQALAKEVPDGR